MQGVSFSQDQAFLDGRALVKNSNDCLNTNIYSRLEPLGAQGYNLYLIVVHIFNNSVI
jgi:hypothetical protein